MPIRVPFIKRKYYWIVAKSQSGKTVLLYPPYASENEARNKGWEKMKGNLFNVVPLDTKDLAKATRAYRSTVLEKTGDLDYSIERMDHQGKDIEETEEESQE